MLEMLVMTPDERSTARDMPVRICWILGENAKPEDRTQIANTVSRLYSNRSIVAHGRALEVKQFSPDLWVLRQLAFELVQKLAKCNSYSAQKEVANWVDAKLMGAPIPFDTTL